MIFNNIFSKNINQIYNTHEIKQNSFKKHAFELFKTFNQNKSF